MNKQGQEELKAAIALITLTKRNIKQKQREELKKQVDELIAKWKSQPLETLNYDICLMEIDDVVGSTLAPRGSLAMGESYVYSLNTDEIEQVNGIDALPIYPTGINEKGEFFEYSAKDAMFKNSLATQALQVLNELLPQKVEEKTPEEERAEIEGKRKTRELCKKNVYDALGEPPFVSTFAGKERKQYKTEQVARYIMEKYDVEEVPLETCIGYLREKYAKRYMSKATAEEMYLYITDNYSDISYVGKTLLLTAKEKTEWKTFDKYRDVVLFLEEREGVCDGYQADGFWLAAEKYKSLWDELEILTGKENF